MEIPFDILEFGNGRLPDSALERIGIGGHRLHRAAAAAFARFREAAQGAGIDLTLTDSYRDFDEQVDLKRRKPTLSATPGKSVHGWGFAVDVPSACRRRASARPSTQLAQGQRPRHRLAPRAAQGRAVALGVPRAAARAIAAANGRRPRRTSSSSARAAIGCASCSSACGITADGSFGPQTEAAVMAFQQQLRAHGRRRVGPKTWAAVLAAAAAGGGGPGGVGRGSAGGASGARAGSAG